MAKRITIVGGAGFIGHALYEKLNSLGIPCLVFDKQNKKNIPDKYFRCGDILNSEDLDWICANSNTVLFMTHLGVKQNCSHAIQFEIFEKFAKSGIHILYASSGGAIYGDNSLSKNFESSPLYPVSDYGKEKLIYENFLYILSKKYDFTYVIVRPSNPYGPGQWPFVGQGLIATYIASVICDAEFYIHGDGNNVRDYIYIDDLISGVIDVLHYGHNGESYNIGSSKGISINEILSITNRSLNFEHTYSKIKNLDRRSADIAESVLSTAKIEALNMWQPRVELGKGLLHTYDWLKSNRTKFLK